MDAPGPDAANAHTQSSGVKGDDLAHSLHQLSLNTLSIDHGLNQNHHRSDFQSQRSPAAKQAASPRLSRKSSSTSLRRTSTNTLPDRPPPSPRLNRKSSAANMNDHDPQASPKKPPMRRSSSNQHLSPRSPSGNQAFSSQMPERIPLTAGSVASSHFKKELALHASAENPCSDTIVIVHDSCYGHRFSRPRTSKANLSLIVERPERLQAGVMGLSSAYVRLGGRHCEGDYALHPDKEPDTNLPFRIQKTVRSLPVTSPMVTAVHGTKWMQELKAMCDLADSRLSSGTKELNRPETPTGAPHQAPRPKLHEGDLYLCGESLNAFQGALGGVLDGVDAVFGDQTANGRHKKAFVCVRPPGHHCSADMPSGFCWLNNVHVGIEYAAQTHGLTHAAIIDFDLHHGDGSQSITWDRNTKALKQPKNAPMSKKTMIGYFSLHDINSYPCEWGEIEKVQSASLCIENAHGQSIWNVHLQTWKTEDDFWNLYRERYLTLLEKARNFLSLHTERIRALPGNVQPKGAIFLSAGFDASEWEGEGMQRHKVNVPTEFYARFTADVVKIAEEQALGCDGRIISVLEGGYSDRALMSGVLSHISGLTTRGQDKSFQNSGLASVSEDMATAPVQHPENGPTFNRKWWSSESLAELEHAMNPMAIPAPPKKTRTQELSNFASPTQSFTAKAVDPSKIRSLSGSIQPVQITRPPTPPPPDVEWATAAYELSRLLIPDDRQIRSCRHEELSEPRVKRERYSSVGVHASERPPVAESNRQLRGRKAKGSGIKEEEEDSRPPSQNAPRTDRRRTMSDLSSIVDSVEAPPTLPVPLAGEGPKFSAMPGQTSTEGVQELADTTKAIRPTNPRFNSASNISVPKTRRQSAGKINLTQVLDSDAPPVPQIPDTSNERSSEGPGQPVDGASTVDTLASGVKKLTLKYTPPAEVPPTITQEADKPVTKPARKAPAARIPRPSAPKSGTTKTSKSKLPTTAVAGQTTVEAQASSSLEASRAGMNGIPAPLASRPVESAHEKVSNSNDAAWQQAPELIPTTSSERTSSVVTPETPVKLESSAVAPVEPLDVFIPYNPPQQTTARAETQAHTSAGTNQPLTWLPPNTSTPAQTPVKRGKGELPVFTAQSFIPFASDSRPTSKSSTADSRPTTSSGEGGTTGLNPKFQNPPPTKSNASVWEVPDTPGK